MSNPSRDSQSTLWAVLLTTFQTTFMGSGLNLAIPSVGAEFKAGAVELSWVMTAYILTTAAFLLPLGRVSDRFGRKRLFWIGVVSMVVSSLACGLAPTVTWLVVLRAIQGVASAMAFSTSMAILSATFPAKERGRVFGLAAATTYLGLSAGPVLGGLIAHHLGWRALFFLPTLISVFALLIVLPWRKRNQEECRVEAFDWLGTVLYMVGLPLALYGLSNATRSWFAGGAFLGGGGLLLGFFFWQRRAPSPLLNLRALSGNTAFLFSSLAALIQYAATFALGFLVSLHLQVGRGMEAQAAGWVLLAQPAVMALFSPIAGALSDRIQPRILASAGMALSSLGLLTFVWIDASSSLVWVGLNLGLVGLGFALFSSPNSNSVMSSVAPPLYSLASSMLSTMRTVGQSASMALTTLIVASYVGNRALTPEVAEPLQQATSTAFIVFAGLCGLGVLASLSRGNLPRQSGMNP